MGQVYLKGHVYAWGHAMSDLDFAIIKRDHFAPKFYSGWRLRIVRARLSIRIAWFRLRDKWRKGR